jgi:hypothetical protein
MNELLRITGTAKTTQKNEGIAVCGSFPCIIAIIRKRITVNPDEAKESTTERGYIPPALHLNEQY